MFVDVRVSNFVNMFSKWRQSS